MPRGKEQFQRELKLSAKNCVGLGDYFANILKRR